VGEGFQVSYREGREGYVVGSHLGEWLAVSANGTMAPSPLYKLGDSFIHAKLSFVCHEEGDAEYQTRVGSEARDDQSRHGARKRFAAYLERDLPGNCRSRTVHQLSAGPATGYGRSQKRLATVASVTVTASWSETREGQHRWQSHC
jgi:hypothetical protein